MSSIVLEQIIELYTLQLTQMKESRAQFTSASSVCYQQSVARGCPSLEMEASHEDAAAQGKGSATQEEGLASPGPGRDRAAALEGCHGDNELPTSNLLELCKLPSCN
jgi:hypothetical protein